MKKAQIAILVILLLIIVPVGIKLFLDMKTYSATDILNDATFNTENASIDIERIERKTEKEYITVEVSKETEKEIIKAFEEAGFKKTDKIADTSYDYHITFNLDKSYPMFLDSSKNYLVLTDTAKAYFIEDNSDFSKILKEIKE